MKKRLKLCKKLSAVGAALLLSISCFTGCAGDKLKETDALHIYNIVDTQGVTSAGFYKGMEYYYQMKYPDVAFVYETSDQFGSALAWGDGITAEMGEALQTYYDNVSVSIMKGDCEDVIFADDFYRWFSDVTPPDYTKMIRAGAFIDLKAAISEIAPDLDLSVFDSLLIDGKLYAIPIYRQPYVIYSAENMLQKWDFDFNAQDDILTFLRKCAAWQEQHAGDENAPVVFTKQAWEYIYHNLFNIIGVNVVDFEAGTANFTDPQVLEAVELIKALRSDYEEPLSDEITGRLTEIYDHALFGREAGTYCSGCKAIIGYDYLNDPTVIMPLLQLDGKTATSCDTFMMVPTNAKNTMNAVRYVALTLDAIMSHQMGAKKISSNVSNRNTLFAWDVGADGFEAALTKDWQKIYLAEGVLDTVRDMYRIQADIKMPSYWYHSVKYLFDDYMAGEISIDTLASDVQSRLEIYVSE